MNFYSTLARRNIIFSKQEKLAFKELLVCETHSVNGAVDNVNQVNWLDCDFIYENKKLYLVIKILLLYNSCHLISCYLTNFC